MSHSIIHRRWLDAIVAALAVAALPATADAGPAWDRAPVGSAPAIMRDLAPALVQAFTSQGGSVTIDPPFGPPLGDLDPKLAAFLDGRSDFALLTREVAEGDLVRFRAHHDGLAPIVVPVTGGNWNRFGYVDAVVIIVHRDNPVRRLSYRQLDAIFSSSRLRGGAPVATWGDLGLGGVWRGRAVKVMGGDGWRRVESARALTMRRHVLSVGRIRGEWRAVEDSGDDGDVVERVASDPRAIGFTGMGHLARSVRAVAIAEPGKRPVALDARSAHSGSYPLLRTVDILLAPRPRPETLAFALFLTGREGQAVVARQGDFMPLPPHRLAEARSLLADLR